VTYWQIEDMFPMEMIQLPNAKIVTLLNELEGMPDFNFNSVDYFLRTDDPSSPLILRQLQEAIDEMDTKIPVFKRINKFGDVESMFLLFSKFVVAQHYPMVADGFYYVQTTKGRVRFPCSYQVQAFETVKKT